MTDYIAFKWQKLDMESNSLGSEFVVLTTVDSNTYILLLQVVSLGIR